MNQPGSNPSLDLNNDSKEETECGKSYRADLSPPQNLPKALSNAEILSKVRILLDEQKNLSAFLQKSNEETRELLEMLEIDE